jgi:hypothetical protein
MAKNTSSEKTLIRVRRGRVDSVDLYEVKENELELLENGESTGLQLNFSIFLLSTAFSGIITLCTATFTKPVLQTTFLIVSVIGILLGLYLLLLWWKGRKSIKKVIQTIKDRIKPDSVDECEEEVEVEVVKSTSTQSLYTGIIKPEG